MKHLFGGLILFLIPLATFGQATVKGKSIYYVKNYSETDAKRYFDNVTNLDAIEGIWIMDGAKYSIEKDFNGYSRDNNRFRVIVLTEKKQWLWERGDIQYFLTKGASDNVFEVTCYAFVANWSSGNREYEIQPVLGFGMLTTPVNFTAQLPEFDDYGQEIGTSNDNFVKLYPRK